MWKGTKTMKNRCYLDVHVLQTVPPSCVNRDDTGSPKTAIYGGTTRARVSSQAWKHAIIGNTRFQVSRHKHKKVMETIKREGFMAFLLQNRQIISFLW